jgi:hypothetical protein
VLTLNTSSPQFRLPSRSIHVVAQSERDASQPGGCFVTFRTERSKERILLSTLTTAFSSSRDSRDGRASLPRQAGHLAARPHDAWPERLLQQESDARSVLHRSAIYLRGPRHPGLRRRRPDDRYVICHVSYVMCHMSYVICHMLYVICHAGSHQTYAWSNIQPPILALSLSLTHTLTPTQMPTSCSLTARCAICRGGLPTKTPKKRCLS